MIPSFTLGGGEGGREEERGGGREEERGGEREEEREEKRRREMKGGR